jgi:hypothetical protein
MRSALRSSRSELRSALTARANRWLHWLQRTFKAVGRTLRLGWLVRGRIRAGAGRDQPLEKVGTRSDVRLPRGADAAGHVRLGIRRLGDVYRSARERFAAGTAPAQPVAPPVEDERGLAP